MRSMTASRRFTAALVIVATGTLAAAAGCASTPTERKGAIIGAGTGAVAGGLIGRAAGSTAKGAIIGAAVGGAAGAIIGRRMDQQAAELEKEIPGAEVERVGEGILVTFDSGILFDYDSATVKPAARDNLRKLVTSLEKYPGTNVVLVGHTDADGAEDYNQALSERRATAAADFLVAQGVPRARIDATGRGETEPVGSNETADGKAQNRRVEIAIFVRHRQRHRARAPGTGAQAAPGRGNEPRTAPGSGTFELPSSKTPRARPLVRSRRPWSQRSGFAFAGAPSEQRGTEARRRPRRERASWSHRVRPLPARHADLGRRARPAL